MNMKKIVVCFIGATMTLSLAGCSWFGHRKRNTVAGSNQYADAKTAGVNQGAYTQGVNGGTDYQLAKKCYPTPVAPGTTQRYFFAFNKYNVNNQYSQSLKEQANYLISHPNMQIRVDGNTDDRGSREYNIALGWRRARSIDQVLEQYGVAKRQIMTNSWGAEKPVMMGSTDADFACNRRVDLTYHRG